MKNPRWRAYVVGLLAAVVLGLGTGGCWNDSNRVEGSTYSITTLLLDPTACSFNGTTGLVDCSVIYVATAGGGVYKSTDGGATWFRIVNGLYEWNISSLVMDPSDPGTLYAGTENNGLFKTNDGGLNWTVSGVIGSRITAISSIVINPETCLTPPCTDIYVGSEESGVWVSQDRGLSWLQINNGLSETTVTALNVFSYTTVPSDIYAGTEGGHLYRYNQSINKWEEATPGLSSVTVASPLIIAINPRVPTEMYVGTSGGEAQSAGGTFRTIDGGQTWSLVPIPNAQNFSVRVLTFCLQDEPLCPPPLPDPNDPPANDALRAVDVLYAGVYGLSSNYFMQDTIWTNIDTGQIQAGNNVSSLAIDPVRHTTLYAGTLSGFIIVSQDTGSTWSRIDIN